MRLTGEIGEGRQLTLMLLKQPVVRCHVTNEWRDRCSSNLFFPLQRLLTKIQFLSIHGPCTSDSSPNVIEICLAPGEARRLIPPAEDDWMTMAHERQLKPATAPHLKDPVCSRKPARPSVVVWLTSFFAWDFPLKMTLSASSTFPLGDVSDSQLQALCEALWTWALCAPCSQGRDCNREECPRRRTPRLEPFFQYYREVTASYIPELIMPGSSQAIRSHEDLFDIIRLLHQNPTMQRGRLTAQYFSRRGEEYEPPINDQHRAFNLAVRVMLMINCCIDGQAGGRLELGVEPSVWRGDKSLVEFVSATFPTRDHPTLNEKDESYPDIKFELTAKKLGKVAGLRFKGTDDLRNHLKLDQKTGVVEIYHHTSVLKEHLVASSQKFQGPGVGNLPTQ